MRLKETIEKIKKHLKHFILAARAHLIVFLIDSHYICNLNINKYMCNELFKELKNVKSRKILATIFIFVECVACGLDKYETKSFSNAYSFYLQVIR